MKFLFRGCLEMDCQQRIYHAHKQLTFIPCRCHCFHRMVQRELAYISAGYLSGHLQTHIESANREVTVRPVTQDMFPTIIFCLLMFLVLKQLSQMPKVSMTVFIQL